LVQRNSDSRAPANENLIERGLGWLATHANPDGGWGDTTKSISNISTTTLCWAALALRPDAGNRFAREIAGAEKWLAQQAGSVAPSDLVPAIVKRYGKDRTFSVPILTMCALCGRLGEGREAWRHVPPLPFELAAFPPQWFAALRLPVVSYALPALIAIGQVRHHHRPTRNPIARVMRNLLRERTLAVLERIQPRNGGFLEATPLTSFVAMSLAASGQADHAVTRRAVEFLAVSAQADGSWPIDTNLSTWVTTLAVNALAEGNGLAMLSSTEREAIKQWLLNQQYRSHHPYTNAAPGGWAWTDLPGGVPDADDTGGVLLALRHFAPNEPAIRDAACAGVCWLLDLQNSDGGIPTFCRGWSNLPFDRSSPDLTAHALRAWHAWLNDLSEPLQHRTRSAISKALSYLSGSQSAEGTWVPLWFGNQAHPLDENPTYGTARVLRALQDLPASSSDSIAGMMSRATSWLLEAQTPDGGWSGFRGGPPSVEETALAVEALSGLLAPDRNPAGVSESELSRRVQSGVKWLKERVDDDRWREPSPIGFYFAKLWYYERLYPLIFTVGALGRASRVGGR
jgi:squalene-hopene/tetraprenyl-beta-curcumene cyclase